MLVGLLVLQLLLACQGCLVSFGPLANSITLRASRVSTSTAIAVRRRPLVSSPRRVPEPSFFYILVSRIFYAVGMSSAARSGRIVRGSPRLSSAVAASFPLINFPLCGTQVPLKNNFLRATARANGRAEGWDRRPRRGAGAPRPIALEDDGGRRRRIVAHVGRSARHGHRLRDGYVTHRMRDDSLPHASSRLQSCL